MRGDSFDADVAIVGYGPVGQTLTALLAARGHSVAVYERYPELYDLPRAVYFDDEIKQVWQTLGVVDEIADDLLPVDAYEWLGADGERILRIEHPAVGPSGWASGYVFYQPSLEQALDRAVRALPSARVHQGREVESLEQAGDHVALTVRHEREERVRARYVVGADGANSLVRRAAGIAFDDQGFAERWLVVDVRPDDIEALSWLPSPCQWCDPVRPHMHCRNGRRHRRFEFMLLPGECAEDFADEARIWELLAPWFTPADGLLVRHAVYEFRGRLARTMRTGRVLLAGDAAHTMPPFMGQGLCSGVRDAANLAWRLDLVLRGLGDDRLLDTYSTERRAHNEWIVNLSTEMGRVSCTLDPDAAAQRDAALRATEAPPPLGLPPLQDGTVAPDRPLAGVRAVQGLVRLGDREGRFDDVVGKAFVLLTRHAPEVPLAIADALDAIGAKVVALDELEDLDGRLTAWLDEHRVAAVLIRPDAYVFGAVEALEDLPALVDDLRSNLSITESRITAMSTEPAIIRPKLHHVNLKTNQLQAMIDWYAALLATEVLFQNDFGAWISNDEANHRIALTAFPNLVDDPEKDTRTGLHHTAFEYGSFEDLNASYVRLEEAGIEPAFCLDHGMTLSYYYRDPDGNHVELQVDNFGDWAKSSAHMRESPEFAADPIGKFVDPARVAEAAAAGASFAEIHARAMAGELSPDAPPLEVPRVEV